MGLLPLSGNIGGLLQLLSFDLNVKKGRLDLYFLSVLGRFLHRPVIFKLLKIFLNSFKSVAEVPPLHQFRLVLDPDEELRAEEFVLVLLFLHVLNLPHDVSYPFATGGPRLHFGKRVVVGGNVGHDGLLVRFGHVNVLRVKKLGNAEMLLSHIKCISEITQVVILVQSTEVDQIRTMAVNMRELKLNQLLFVDWLCHL